MIGPIKYGPFIFIGSDLFNGPNEDCIEKNFFVVFLILRSKVLGRNIFGMDDYREIWISN